MSLLKPNFFNKTIYDINYKNLRDKGIKCLLFDLDNTCVGYYEKHPNTKLKNLFKKLNNMNFTVIIFSNATKRRLEPFSNLSVITHHRSLKPLSYNFKKIMKKYNFSKEETCIIGDQLFTDILGGNRVGITTYLVEPLTKEDFIITKIFRKLEQRQLTKLKERKK